MAEPLGRHSMPAQPDATPTAKVTVGALSAALVTVLISVADTFGFVIEPDVAAALVALGGFAAAYLKRSRPGELDL